MHYLRLAKLKLLTALNTALDLVYIISPFSILSSAYSFLFCPVTSSPLYSGPSIIVLTNSLKKTQNHIESLYVTALMSV